MHFRAFNFRTSQAVRNILTTKYSRFTYGIPTLTKLASSNIWSNLSQIYGQTQICGQNCCLYMVKAKYMVKFYMIKLKYMVKRKLWSFSPYMVKHAANIWSKFKKIPFIIVTDMTYLLVNWTDVTSAESAFANKIRDPARAQTYTHDPYLMQSETRS